MPTLIPAVTAPIVPTLTTPAAAGTAQAAAAPAPENSFGSVLAQASATPSATTATAAEAGAAPVAAAVVDPTRVAAEAAAGSLVVAPGVVVSSTGAVLTEDVTRTGDAAAAVPGPPSDADRTGLPPDATSRAEQLRLRLAVAPQALPQPANARPITTQTVTAEPVAAEATEAATATATPAVPNPAAAQLPLPASAAIPLPATGLPAGRSPSVVAQVPVVSDLVVPTAAPPTTAQTAAPPVTATVAPAPLPGVTVGDRPNVAGDRLAADAADGARLAATAPATQPPPAAFAQVLAGTTPTPPAAPGAETVRLPQGPAPTASVGGPTGGDIRVSQPTPAAPATSASPVAPAAVPAAPVVTTPTASSPIAPAAVAPRSNVAAPLTPTAVAPPADAPAPNTARTVVAEPTVVTSPKTPAVPAGVPTPLPVTFAELLRARPAADFDPAPATPTDVTPDANAAAAFAAPAPSTPPASPAAPTPTTAPAAPAAVQVADGVVAHARVLDRDGTVEFRMRLDPPELGRVYVRLLSDGDAVRGHVVVADEAVRQVIESQLPELRQRLEAAGLSVGRFDVSADPGAGGRGNPYQTAAPEAGTEPAAAAPKAAARPAAPARSGRIDVTV